MREIKEDGKFFFQNFVQKKKKTSFKILFLKVQCSVQNLTLEEFSVLIPEEGYLEPTLVKITLLEKEESMKTSTSIIWQFFF